MLGCAAAEVEGEEEMVVVAAFVVAAVVVKWGKVEAEKGEGLIYSQIIHRGGFLCNAAPQ